jgi:hypothetical protein
MISINHVGRIGRALALGTAMVAAIGFATPQPAHALSTGAAVGIGLGAAAVGTAVGAAAANPYYNGYYAAPAYGYAPAPVYGAPPPRSCWSPYYNQYVPC